MLGTPVFQGAYREEVTVAGSIRLRLRIIQPADKQKLAEGFQRLSPESRYRRFLNYKRKLTPGELRHFTEFDGVNHLAIGAFERDEAGAEGAVVGVARFIRCPEDAEGAECSIVVSDNRQGRGIGRQLLERLLAAAAERGVRHFQGYLLAENTRVRRLIQRVCPEAIFRQEGEMVTVACAVPTLLPLAPLVAVAGETGWCDWLGRLTEGVILAALWFWVPLWRSLLSVHGLFPPLPFPSWGEQGPCSTSG